MASWADEFDIDDSDILSALNNRRKDPSQLASPPWPLAAAGPRPPPLPLTTSSADAHHPIASSASLLKRFQRPRTSQNRPFISQYGPPLSQNLATQRKRKPVDVSAPSLPQKSACRQGPSLNDALCGEDPCLSLHAAPTENVSQIEHVCHPDQRANDAGNGVTPVQEYCHSLSSHENSPSPAAGGVSRCYSRIVQSQRQDDFMSSQQPLRDIQQNAHSSYKVSTVAPAAKQSLKQNSDLDSMRRKRPYPVRFQENGGDESKRIANQKRLKDVRENFLEQPLGMHSPNLLRKSIPNDRSETGHRRDSPGVRFLPKDLNYHIPGPAGAVQKGLGQNTDSFYNDNRMRKNNPAPCRASVIDDADFQSGAWLRAKNYIEKSSIALSTISSLKISRTENRVSRLLAVIKSCIPNGCGDAMVSLKDQTDSIHGTVNRRVMSETEFGRIMEPGAVILLHQVAVFSPTPYAHYLNITINNVEQVFRKELQFFKGECSRAASKAVLEVTEDDEQMEDVDNRSKSRKEDLCAQKPGKNGHSTIDQLLEEEDELEIILACSAHRTTQELERAEADKAPAEIDARQSGRGSFDSPMRDELPPNLVNDGYDQLLDDTDLFACLQTRYGVI